MSIKNWRQWDRVVAFAALLAAILGAIAGWAAIPGVLESLNLKNANNQSSDARNNRNDSNVQIPSSSETISVALAREDRAILENIGTSAVFTEDVGIRFNISVVEKGYLYILQKGSSGKKSFLFPDSQYNDGKNDVEANKAAIIPDRGWLYFDGQKGPETVYVIYSKVKDRLIGKDAESSQSSLRKDTEQEVIDFLDKLRSNSRSDSFTTPNGNLVRVITLRHE